MTYASIGFMQGRLSPILDGKIQTFPWTCWQDEFLEANKLGLQLMEWTLDHDRLYENPIINEQGQTKIRKLCTTHRIRIESLTGDCFMQAPFFKVDGDTRSKLLQDLKNIINACSFLNIRYVVFPLVDNSRLETLKQENQLIGEFSRLATFLEDRRVAIVFESDYPPRKLSQFIRKLPSRQFGINYDIGNSAALGFNSAEEISAYGDRIWNVHVKDRKLGGTTVPLGCGQADLPSTVGNLVKSGYTGNYILQTARANDGQHAATLDRYRKMLVCWLKATNNGT